MNFVAAGRMGNWGLWAKRRSGGAISGLRQLLWHLIGGLGLFLLASRLCPGAQFSVVASGAVGDGITDDAAAFNGAINSCIAAPGTGNEVFIPSGKYRLSKSIEVKGAKGITIRGEPGTLLITDDGQTACMRLNYCQNVTVESLSFDRAKLSFTQGTITAINANGMTCDVSIDAGYLDPNEPQFANGRLHPLVSPKTGTYQLDRYSPGVVSWEKTGDRTWHVLLNGHPPTDDLTGKRFFFWSDMRGHCFEGFDLTDCTFQDINYWGAGGNAGLYLARLSGTTTFRHFVIGVPPGSDRLFSCAGGGQISDIRGKLDFEDCDFTKIDDDGLDILGTWTRVVEQRDARTILLQINSDYRPGDHVSIWDWAAKKSRTEAVVVKADANPDHSILLVLDRDVKIEKAGVGDGKPFGMDARADGIDRVIDLDTLGSQTAIRNCRFQVFRAKCLNLKANNCIVEGCTFFDSWQPAISAAPEWYFEEGPPIRNLTIRNNRFLNCNHSNIDVGASPDAGYDKPTGVPPASRDSVNVVIENNYFAEYGRSDSLFRKYWPIGDAIRVQNTRGVTIQNNTIGRPAEGAPNSDKIIIADCDDVVLKNNDGVTRVDPAPLPQHSVAVDAAQAQRLHWFREAKFGMFIHWGLYSVPAGEWDGATNFGEWIMMSTRMPAATYAQFAPQFNPVKFDPKSWAHLAASAGMKYVVLTAKHHEGFALWDTQQTPFNVVKATPFGRDVVKELGNACRAEGLKFCVYYSDTDWRNPDFPPRYNPAYFHGDPHPDADMDKYLAFMKAQLRELLTNYGPLGILWFDNGGGFGGYDMGKVMHGQELVDLVHQLQPDCLVNNRSGVPGDYGTPEQEIPPTVLQEPWETCMTMNDHWGYNKHDENWKTTDALLSNLVDIVSKGGNYLLNVGPTSEGLIPSAASDRLAVIGQWLKRNGEAIYGAGPTPFGAELGGDSPTEKDAAGKPKFVPGDKWRFTTKPGKLFVILYRWPDGPLALPAMKNSVVKASLLAAPATPITINFANGVTYLDLPKAAPDEFASVLELDLKP